MSVDESMLVDIPGLIRMESVSHDEMLAHCLELGAAPDDGRYCTVAGYVDCPPEEAYEYLRLGRHLEEWTYSLRDFEPTDTPDLWVGRDLVVDDTRIYCRVVANPDAMTVDFHCAWDQSDRLWMIYLMRVVPAQPVLDRPGSVITWTNCRHPYYSDNPHPELAPSPDRRWVGDLWDLFRAGHTVELNNLTAILEHRHRNGIPVSAPVMGQVWW